ncbi:MAG: hypothetical protein U0794_14710 [Isosphaeraceae bacterium]
MTTGALLVWTAAVGLVLGLLRGDLLSFIPEPVLRAGFWLGIAVPLAVVVVIPWLAHRAEQSHDPAVRSPWTDREHRLANVLVLACLGLLTAALFALGLLGYWIATAS